MPITFQVGKVTVVLFRHAEQVPSVDKTATSFLRLAFRQQIAFEPEIFSDANRASPEIFKHRQISIFG